MKQRKDCPNTNPLGPVEHWQIITILAGIKGEVYFQPNFLIFKKQKEAYEITLLSGCISVCVCVSPLIFEAYEITLLSVCVSPLFFFYACHIV
jgi:hypothetical protein